jgi:hypothetical protein
MYSIYKWVGVSGDGRNMAGEDEHLISPQKFITESVLQTVPRVQKLGDAMASYMLCKVLCLFPLERGSERQKAHGWAI